MKDEISQNLRRFPREREAPALWTGMRWKTSFLRILAWEDQ